MHILHLEPANVGQQGDHVYRTLQPCRALAGCEAAPRVLSGTWLGTAARRAAEHADVLVLCKVVEVDLLPLIARRRTRGLPTVFEINDDFTDVQPWNSTAGFYAQPENRSLVTQLARRCDAVQFSSHGLADKFGHLNGRSRLVPNQLAEVPPHRPRDPEASVVLGWGGSFGHREDLAAVMPALKAVLAARPTVKLSVMGDPRLRKLFGWVGRGRLLFTRAGSLAAYRRFLASLDIGIAPLLDTAFNRGRSDVKRLEYAAHGVVPVCADLTPYRKDVTPWHDAVLFADNDELQAALLRLADAQELRAAIAARAHAQVASRRLQAQHAPALLAFYASLGKTASSEDAEAFVAVWEAQTQDPEAPGHRTCGTTRAEQHLYNGLVSQADPRRSRRDFEQARKLEPNNYLSHLHLARLQDARDRGAVDRCFGRAASLSPDSCAVPFLWALSRLAADDPAGASEKLQAAVAIAPAYAPAWMRLAALCEQRGDIAAAREHYARSLVENPDYGVAAIALAGLHVRARALPDAQAVLEAHAEACDGDPRYWILLGQLALMRRDGPAALAALEAAKRRCQSTGASTEAISALLEKAETLAR